MGMSSSQARLLHLTTRMHQIEYKAAKLEAEKLQLANDSSRAYEDYLAALEATKIQYGSLSQDGSIEYKNATLNAMENGILINWNGETASNILFLQNMDGKIMVTPAVAEKYNLTSTGVETRDLDTFVQDSTGKTKTDFPVYKDVPVYRQEPNMVTKTRDSEFVASFTPIANTTVSEYTVEKSHTFAPIENLDGGIDYSALEGYSKFDDTHTEQPSETPSIDNETTNIVADQNYVISDAEGLYQLMQLSNSSSFSNVTVTLTNDIDLSGYNWTGIKNFSGTFDGNGFKISNLNGTQGLFASTNNATIQNVGLENVNISGNSACIGGLIGKANSTSISNCYTTGSVTNTGSYTISDFTTKTTENGTGGLVGNISTPGGKTAIIDNTYSSATVTATNCDGVGGLIGAGSVAYSNGKFDITNSYAIGNVSGRNGVGGFIGSMHNDEDNASDITDIRNCYSGGNVSGSNKVGGFMGAYLYWGDNGDRCEIEGCQSSGKVSATGDEKGAFAGHLYVKMRSATETTLSNYLINFIDCSYADNTGVSNAYGIITDENGGSTATVGSVTKTIDEFVQDTGSGAGLVSFKIAGSIPSINADGSGDYMQNIMAVLVKSNSFDSCDPEVSNAQKVSMENNIKRFLTSFADTDSDNEKLWNLNQAICNYLNDEEDENSSLENLPAALLQDINNGTKSATAEFQAGGNFDGTVKRASDSGKTVTTGSHSVTKGEVEIPSRKNIADQLYYLLNQMNEGLSQSAVVAYINQYSTTNADDKATLANINDRINDGNVQVLANSIRNGVKYVNTSSYPTDKYEVSFASDKTVSVSWIQETYQVQEGTVDVFDHYEKEFDYNESRWDTTDAEIANAIAMYAMVQRGVVVVTDAQASSSTWLANMVQSGDVVFTTFDPAQIDELAKLAAIAPTTVNNMTDAEYNDFMGIENTSVSVETGLREVKDETNLKKAEAQYEASMLKIDRKERLYDKDLSALEAERNAVKQEMETLKTVAKENVERTFKLFG